MGGVEENHSSIGYAELFHEKLTFKVALHIIIPCVVLFHLQSIYFLLQSFLNIMLIFCITKIAPHVTFVQIWYLWKTQKQKKKFSMTQPRLTTRHLTGPTTTAAPRVPGNTTRLSQMAAHARLCESLPRQRQHHFLNITITRYA